MCAARGAVGEQTACVSERLAGCIGAFGDPVARRCRLRVLLLNPHLYMYLVTCIIPVLFHVHSLLDVVRHLLARSSGFAKILCKRSCLARLRHTSNPRLLAR